MISQSHVFIWIGAQLRMKLSTMLIDASEWSSSSPCSSRSKYYLHPYFFSFCLLSQSCCRMRSSLNSQILILLATLARLGGAILVARLVNVSLRWKTLWHEFRRTLREEEIEVSIAVEAGSESRQRRLEKARLDKLLLLPSTVNFLLQPDQERFTCKVSGRNHEAETESG